MIIPVNIETSPYDIVLERGVLKNLKNHLNLSNKTMILTDSGVPKEYAETVKAACDNAYIETIPQGEASKCFDSYKMLVESLASHGFTRKDRVIAVGGGVCGDLAGFVASTYMRGIEFINIPTTLLSQVDSSIGGKTAIDLNSIKNIIGAFYQPSKVIIDPDTLNTLDKRQLHAGLVEAIKMAATNDAKLFSFIENSTDLNADIEKIIEGALKIKRDVVVEDPTEKGLRKVLNFGHTIGHAYESCAKGALFHGEAVALGCLLMCEPEVKDRLITVFQKYDLPTDYQKYVNSPESEIREFMSHDKKMTDKGIACVYVPAIGSFEFRTIKLEDIRL